MLEDEDADVLVDWFDAFEGDEEEVLLLETVVFAPVLPSLFVGFVVVLLLTCCTESMLPVDYGGETVTV